MVYLQIPIKVLPVDDELPRIFVNTGLYIKAAVEEERPEWKYITNTELRAEDLDSPNGNFYRFTKHTQRHLIYLISFFS